MEEELKEEKDKTEDGNETHLFEMNELQGKMDTLQEALVEKDGEILKISSDLQKHEQDLDSHLREKQEELNSQLKNKCDEVVTLTKKLHEKEEDIDSQISKVAELEKEMYDYKTKCEEIQVRIIRILWNNIHKNIQVFSGFF